MALDASVPDAYIYTRPIETTLDASIPDDYVYTSPVESEEDVSDEDKSAQPANVVVSPVIVTPFDVFHSTGDLTYC